MIYFIIAGILILIVIVVGYFVIRSRLSRESDGMGFFDYVKNPSMRGTFSDRLGAQKEAVKYLMAEPPEQLVAMLAAPVFDRTVFKAIIETGEKATPGLVSALQDPAYHVRYEGKQRHSLDPRGPLIAVLDCLRHVAPAEAAAPLSSLVSDKDNEIREKAGFALGLIGTDECLPALAIALADEDKYVQSHTISGIEQATNNRQLTTTFREAMFDLLTPFVWANCFFTSTSAATTMLKLDRDRTIQILASKDDLLPPRDGLDHVLYALGKADVVIEEGLLLDLATHLRQSPLDKLDIRSLSATLKLLSLHDSDETLEAIRVELMSPDTHVREHAAIALAARKGLRDPFGFAFDRLSDTGWDALTAPQRHLLAVRIMTDEVNNGGFSQYFVNGSGDHWPVAREGLVAMNAQADLELLDSALAFFGDSKPSTDARKRHRQLAKVVRRNDEVFSDIESRFYKDTDALEYLMLLYIMKHPEHFC